MQRRYFCADVETTGVTPSDRIVELAWLEVDESLSVVDEWHSLIDPEIPIDPGASGVHGITNAHVADSPTIEQFFSIVHPGLITGEAVLIAHNAPFDRRFLAPWFENLVGTIDTLRLSRRYFPEASNHKLQTLRYTFGLDAGAAHSAAGDVKTLHHLLRVLVDKSGMSLPELHRDSYQPLFVHTAPFGKHKGKSWDQVPPDYIRWLSSLEDLDPDLKFTLQKLKQEAA